MEEEGSREETTTSESSADGVDQSVDGVEWQDDELVITLISCSGVYSYTVPSFPVFNATLKGIQYECVGPDGTVKVVDGFIRDDPWLSSVTFPANASIKRNYRNAFFVSVSVY